MIEKNIHFNFNKVSSKVAIEISMTPLGVIFKYVCEGLCFSNVTIIHSGM